MGKIEGLEMAVISDYAGNNHWMNLVQIESEIEEKDKMSEAKALALKNISELIPGKSNK